MMDIKDFTRNPGWGICIYKVPYIKKRKIISPGIIIFNKVYIYRNPEMSHKVKIDEDVFNRVINLDKNLWVKGIDNSGSLYFIKGRKERWKKHHETSKEDWERFDFAFGIKSGFLKIPSTPLARASLINIGSVKPIRIEKRFDLCLIDTIDYRYKTQLKLAKAIKLFEDKYKKRLSVYFFGEIRQKSKDYFKRLEEFLVKNKISYKIGYFSKEKFIKEMNKCRINVTMKQYHGCCRAITETAAYNLPQIITDGFGKYASSLYFMNMLNNKNYNLGVKFKHDDVVDLSRKIKFVLDNINSFNTKDYILEEENSRISQDRLNKFFRAVFKSRGFNYKYLDGHIFKLGSGLGTSFDSFFNSNLDDVERLTIQIKYKTK